MGTGAQGLPFATVKRKKKKGIKDKEGRAGETREKKVT